MATACTQVTPLSEEVQTLSTYNEFDESETVTATSLVPSEEELIEYQEFVGAAVCTQVTPLSAEVQIQSAKSNIWYLFARAASLVPSEEETIRFQYRGGAEVCAQVTPLSTEVRIQFHATAASLVPSEEDAIAIKACMDGSDLSVQVADPDREIFVSSV